jgi:hypothetical protein
LGFRSENFGFVCWRVLLDGEEEDTGKREERECKNMRERKRKIKKKKNKERIFK